MFFTETNKVSRSAVLAGCFLFTSCLGASVAQSMEQAQAPGKSERPPRQSKGQSPFRGLFLLEAGYTYTHWNPEKISGTEVETQGLNLAWIELQPQ
ncbi:MAG: hypothetical protein D3916_12515, partial [Candidatus Electrothrix sp. MAN1_4]|nr:hypothetical protein [Candidatus Electrothrix sp. MAN1_4]